MANMMRNRHSKSDTVRENPNDPTELECTCGWSYKPDPEFKDAVAFRHAMEGNLL